MLEQWRAWPVRTRVRAVIIAVVVVVVLLILYSVREALVPFLLGLLLAYILLPLVYWLQCHMPARMRRRKSARLIAILLVYAAGLGLIAAFFAFLAPVIITQIEELIASWDTILLRIDVWLRELEAWYLTTFPDQVRLLIEDQVRQAGGQVLTAVQRGIVGGLTLVGNVIGVLFGYLVVPIFVFYLLYEEQGFRRAVMRVVPECVREDAVNIARVADDVLSAYIKGQLLLASIVGVLTWLALSLLGVNFSVLLGFVAGVGDLIPTLGPILAAIPALIIAALERPILALWALLALLAIQQFEGNILGPRIVGSSVHLNPAIIIFLLVVGGALWGLWGVLLIVPLAAALRDMLQYTLIRTSAEGVTPSEALQRIRRERLEGRG